MVMFVPLTIIKLIGINVSAIFQVAILNTVAAIARIKQKHNTPNILLFLRFNCPSFSGTIRMTL